MMGRFLLYSRAGCCLCEGLEERLRQLMPPEALLVVDVDGDAALQARYGLAVPVLARLEFATAQPGEPGQSGDSGAPVEERIRPLPPVPPRLRGDGLRAWLERHAPP